MIIALQTLVFFRESLLSALDRLVSPYYKRIRGTFNRYSTEEEEDDEEVFAEFDDEKGVVFYPPMYAQRYAAVSDCLMDERWCGKLAKVVDLGYHDMSFIKYLKDLPGVECILGVDIESIPLRCSSDLLDCGDYVPKRESPLQVTLFQGNAADPDYRLIGCDAVVAIEMIEHMLPHDLDRLVHTVFGFVKPWVAIFTTPNADFNELFKSLEKNGLRRWDHFFEWTREQFHDWCSNIVSRYPQFTVTCQGIGPGPAGTEHYGCCSQLALFVNKNYVKQQDLNLNSLTLVSNVPSPQNLAELVDGFASPITEHSEIAPKQNVESLTDFLYSNKQSCVTLIFSSPAFSLTNIEYKDKTSQCNLDTEVGKNFLMFNDEDMYYTMLMPRRKVDHRVYEIEDVASRLNCTTFQARKFSKTTQNLMAKNKIDSLAHTREVVSEIRNLTKMLNFNRDLLTQREDGLIWYNINWGDNAPYWNQYYKVVREYNYPFEQKSEECRILDLVSEEINQLIDMHYDDECTSHESKLEIPIEFLMKAVRHITNDVDKVKDLLEWNGYTVSGNFVIHSRMLLESASAGSTEIDWPENDTTSELDTLDVQSTTISEGSAVVPDIHGRCLRRTLDKKVKALRSMLSADEDIATELDRVVCKLMKLALRTSKDKQEAPPARWMQFKLLDLLTLTEKAISMRKMHYIQSSPVKMIGVEHFDRNINILTRMMREDRAARMIVDKYNHLIQENETRKLFDDLDFGFEDELAEFSSNEFLKDLSPKSYVVSVTNGEVSVMNENLELVCYPDHVTSDQESSKGARKKYTRSPTGSFILEENSKQSRKRPYSNITDDKLRLEDKPSKTKKSKTNVTKKPRAKTSSNSFLRAKSRKVANDYGNYVSKSRRVKLQPSPSKPIPASLTELCHPEVNLLLHSKTFQFTSSEKFKDRDAIKDQIADVAATEESVLIDIVMDDMEETIALRRSIGTDADQDYEEIEQEEILSNVVNEVKNYSSYNKLPVPSENVHSQTIFLLDINEPSTSKGVRHISMDVQCGTDTILQSGSLVTPHASITKLPKMYSTGIRIDSLTNIATEKKSLDFGTCTNNDYQTSSVCKSSSIFSKGIKIKDSRDNLAQETPGCCIATADMHVETNCRPVLHAPRVRMKDSWVDMESKRSYDFGTSTDNGIKIYRNLSPSSIDKKYSGTMTEAINSENDKCKTNISINSISGYQSNTEEVTSVSPGTKSPDMFTTLKSDGSLANLLINFNAKTDYQRNDFESSARSKSPDSRQRSPDSRYESFNIRGITIKDSSTDSQIRRNLDQGTSTIGDWNASSAEPPIVFTRVKMIDLVSEVSIEHEAKIEPSSHFPSSQPCKLVNSRYIPERPHEFKFKLKNSLQVQSYTRDIDTSTHNNGEELDRKSQTSYKINFPSNKIVEYSNCQVCTKGGEENYGYHFDTTFKTTGSFTNVNIPKHSVIVQNDTLGTTNACLPQTKSYGFKVKDSEENVIKKVEFSSTRVELLSDTLRTPSQIESSKTEILNSVSSKVKMEDSATEFYSSFYCASPKSGLHATTSSVNTSECKVNNSLNRQSSTPEKTSLSKVFQNKLSCGGVHIHSFKEKQISEDVVYQGEWKRHVPRLLRKQYRPNTVVAKKGPELIKKSRIKREPVKEKLQIKKIETKYEIKNEPTKPLQVRNTKQNKTEQRIKAKQEVISKSEQIKKIALPNLAKAIRANNKTLTKTTSKNMSSTITSKNFRSMRLAKKPPNSVKLAQSVKNDCAVKSEPIKRKDIDYLPPYLRRKKFASSEMKLKNSLDSNKTSIRKSRDNSKESLSMLGRSYDAVTKSDLTKMQNDPRSNVNYLVFRNDIENTNPPANSSQSADITNRNEITNRRRSVNRRSSSPLSQTSSNCSTSDSITTVKATNNWTRASRRHSTSSNKSSIINTDSETSPSANKNRKFSKKCKINKKADGKDHSNKENLPESSKTYYSDKEMNLQNIKSAFMSRNKNVFMAKLKDSGLALNDKRQNTTKSNIKIPALESDEEKNKPSNISKRKSQSDDSSSKEDILRHQGSIKSSEASNLVLLVEPHKDHIKMKENTSHHVAIEEPVLKVVDSNLLTEWFERGNISAIDRENAENAILAQMRQLVEERLDFINNSLNDPPFDDNLSLKSYRTIVPAGDTDLNNSLKSEIENAMNHSLDAVLGDESDFSLPNESAIDVDLFSFKSVTSASRYSDYYLAESDASKIADHAENKTVSSVLDIFERKDLTPRIQQPTGALAAQAFSGFSMDGNPVMGDQPDYVSAVDSEIAVDVTRQATSEEMFISGRSSETYESCVVEEEVAVPDWLFHVMNPHLVIDQQRPDPVARFDSETGSPSQGYTRLRPPIEEDEDQDQELVPLRMPMVEPVFDANGNVVEPGIGLGAGAGDGRGMHSDHSQDSSGRGSSLSSTDASSGQQSEAILIDPSAYTTQLELFYEPVDSSMAVTTLVVPVGSIETGRQGRHEGAIVSTSRNVTRPPLTSDGEADVSSIDTDDIPDSS